MLWFTLRFAQEARRTEFELIFNSQKEVQQLLARCVVPGGSRSQSGDPAKFPSLLRLGVESKP
jgi:hypothetical protein